MLYNEIIDEVESPARLCSKHISFKGDIKCPLDIWDDVRTIDDILTTIKPGVVEKWNKHDFMQLLECVQMDVWNSRKKIFGDVLGTTMEQYLMEGDLVLESGTTYIVESVNRCRVTYEKSVKLDTENMVDAFELVSKSVGHGSNVWVYDGMDDEQCEAPHSKVSTTIDCIVTTPYKITSKTIRRAQDAYFKVRREMVDKLKRDCGLYNTDITQLYLEIREAFSNHIIWSVGNKPKTKKLKNKNKK